MAGEDRVPALADVASRLSIDAAQLQYCVVLGSRLWGTAGRKSDWDLLIVTKGRDGTGGKGGKKGEKGRKRGKGTRGGAGGSADEAAEGSGRRMVHSGQFDGMIMDSDAYVRAVHAHSFLELASLFVPARFVVHGAPPLPARVTELDTAALSAAVAAECARDWARLSTAFGKGDVARARKEFVHSMRMARLSLQLVEEGRVVDFAAANALHYELQSDGSDWSSFEAHRRPQLDEAVAELRRSCEAAGEKRALDTSEAGWRGAATR